MDFPPSVLSELPCLLVVAEELHFGRAAARLNISQPRVSHIVKRIEDVVGYKVFVRRPQVHLTPAGEFLIKSARDALGDLGDSFARAADIAAGRGVAVRLGYSPVAMLTHLPHLLKTVRHKNPQLAIELVEDDTANLWPRLERSEFDIILSREARARPGIRNDLFLKDGMVAALPEGDPAADESGLDIQKLSDRDFIMINEAASPQWHHAMTSCCRSAGFDPRPSMRIDDWPGILSLVASGAGVSVVSSTLAQVKFPGVEFVPFQSAGCAGSFWLSYHDKAATPSVEILRTGLMAGARLNSSPLPN